MIRKTILSLFAVISILSFLAVSAEIARSEPYFRVDAVRGLHLRTSPDLKAAVIVTIPNGAKVVMLEEKDPEIELDGKKGKWTRVGYDVSTGWVFGGFLVEEEKEITLQELIGRSFSFSIEEVDGADSTSFEILPGGQFKAECLLHGSGDAKIEGTYRAVINKGIINFIIKATAKGHHVAETERRWTQKFSSGEVSISRKKGVYRGTFKLPICDGIINKKLDAR